MAGAPPLSSVAPDSIAEYLRERSRWIRDYLDPQVARHGPDALHSDEILTLDELLRELMSVNISLEDIRYSRLHNAILDITGRATRWPRKIIDRCDALKAVWEAEHGPMTTYGIPLYERGGRLHGICDAQDLDREKLLMRWLRTPGTRLSPAVARKTGDLGFNPGESVFSPAQTMRSHYGTCADIVSWWISALFAFHAGIIDSPSLEHGIVSDSRSAYAIVMTDGDEIAGFDPDNFQYRSRPGDPGRYRLTAGTPESRHPIRILRHHSLHSLCKPRAGLRYDGLYKVTGWTLHTDLKTRRPNYLINFKRLPNESSMANVLFRPWSCEVDDYAEYKRIRRNMRETLDARAADPAVTGPYDGILEHEHLADAQVSFGQMETKDEEVMAEARNGSICSKASEC